jgi:hypothetical protein
MIKKKILNQQRIRKIEGSFAFIEHRFLRQGFWRSLNHPELLLYMFLVLAADRHGVSYYSYDKICSQLGITLDEYLPACDGLINKDFIAFDGYFFQVLSLPGKPRIQPAAASVRERAMEQAVPEHIQQLVDRTFRRAESA